MCTPWPWYKLHCSSKGSPRPINKRNEDTHPVTRAIGISHACTACKDGFRQHVRSHRLSVLFSKINNVVFRSAITHINWYQRCISFHRCHIFYSPQKRVISFRAHTDQHHPVDPGTSYIQCSPKESRRTMSLMRAHTQQYARSKYHTQPACKDEFRRNLEISQPDGVNVYLYNIRRNDTRELLGGTMSLMGEHTHTYSYGPACYPRISRGSDLTITFPKKKKKKTTI